MPSSLKLTFKREETVGFPSGEYHPTQQHLFYNVKVFYFWISWLLQSNSWLTRSQNFYLLILEISPSSSLYKWENGFFFFPPKTESWVIATSWFSKKEYGFRVNSQRELCVCVCVCVCGFDRTKKWKAWRRTSAYCGACAYMPPSQFPLNLGPL